MKILIIIMSLLLGLPVLAEPSEPLQLTPGQAFTSPESGAFISDGRAVLIREAYERERLEATLCKDELAKKESPYMTALFAGGAGLIIGIVIGVLSHK